MIISEVLVCIGHFLSWCFLRSSPVKNTLHLPKKLRKLQVREEVQQSTPPLVQFGTAVSFLNRVIFVRTVGSENWAPTHVPEQTVQHHELSMPESAQASSSAFTQMRKHVCPSAFAQMCKHFRKCGSTHMLLHLRKCANGPLQKHVGVNGQLGRPCHICSVALMQTTQQHPTCQCFPRPALIRPSWHKEKKAGMNAHVPSTPS